MNNNVAIRAINGVVWCLWPVTVLAATETFGATFRQISFAAWIVVVLLSGVSGLVALLQRLKNSELTGNWRIFVIAHMAGAELTGAVTFFGCEALDTNDFLQAALIALASFGGAAVMDKWAAAFADRVSAGIAAAANPKGKSDDASKG